MNETIKAIFMVGLPIALASFLLAMYVLKKTKGKKNSFDKKEKGKNIKEPQGNNVFEQLFLNNLFKFGGGFYGAIAFLTYVYIEVLEIIDFVQNGELVISFGALIEFFIESFMNFIMAIAWPAYWLANLPIKHFWIWFVVAIIAHSLGNSIANQVFKSRQQ